MNVLNSYGLDWYVNRGFLSDVAKVSFGISALQQYRRLRIADNIGTNERHKVKVYQTGIGKERRYMMMIFPNRFIHTHDLHDGLVQWKSLCEIV